MRRRYFISVAAIMPHAPASGKPRRHQPFSGVRRASPRYFRKAE
jgi:hypothetical protein